MDEKDMIISEEAESITLPLVWHPEDKTELLESTFAHSSETIKKNGKGDFLLTVIGIFAVICFGIMIYQCLHYNSFSSINIICFICYIVIAVLFIPKPMQHYLSKTSWNLSTNKFSTAADSSDTITLGSEKAEFMLGKKDVSVAYKYMEAIFETVNYYILMVESKKIIPIAKYDLTEDQNLKVAEILAPYLPKAENKNEPAEDTDDTESDIEFDVDSDIE